MNVRQVAIVLFKEITDLIRDRRTLLSMVVVPVLIMPVLVFGMGLLTAKVMRKAQEDRPNVVLLGGADSPRVMEALRALNTVRWETATDDFTNRVARKEVRSAVRVPDDFDARVAAGEPTTVEVFVNEGELRSGLAAKTLESFFRDWRESMVQERLAARQLSPSLVKPFDIARRNVAPPSQVAGNIFGALLPYMVILLCMTGGMYPAMDLTAGEKERGTMETILCSPVGRLNLVLGKFLMVVLAAITTAVLALASMALTFLIARPLASTIMDGSGPAGDGLSNLSVDPGSVALVFFMILPVIVFLAASELAIALCARSFREAQTYLTPLIFLVIIPSVASMTPGIELSARLIWIPVLNVSLVCKEIMSGNWPWGSMAVVFFTTWLYAAAALFAAVKLFHREEVLLRV